MGGDTQTELLKHLATLSTTASVVVVALRGELNAGALSWSVALFFLALLLSVGCLAWKAFFNALTGEQEVTDQQLGLPTMVAYLSFLVGTALLVFSLVLA